MPLVSSDLTKLITAGLRADFNVAYHRRLNESIVGRIATVIPTTLPTQDYGWLSGNPTMREFVDERRLKALKELSQTITDKTWEATLGVSRRALEDDQYGAIRLRVQDLANEAARHREKICVQKYALGATTVCADGQYLIDDDHPESGTNQDNKTTNALSEAEVAAGIAAMEQFTDDQGEPLGIIPTVLLVGPKNQFVAKRIVNSTVSIASSLGATNARVVEGSSNPLQGMLDVIVSPYLTGTYDDYWFLIDGTRAVKGVILQERSDVPVEFTAVDNPDAEEVFMRDQLMYGVRARYEVGFGLWQTVYGGIL